MRTWRRAFGPKICGLCGVHGTPIRKGDPYLEIRIASITESQERCTRCAGEPVPDTIESLAGDRPDGHQATPNLFPIGTLAADWKQRQGGDV